MQRHDDVSLIRLARGGSLDALGELFDRYWPVAWRAAYAVTGDRTLADDVAQEAVQSAFAALDRFDPRRPFAPWLKRIAANEAVDALRRRRRASATEERAEALLVPLARGEAADVGWLVEAAVAALPPQKRAVLVLHYWLDFPVQEVAEILDLPVGTVASRLSRALAELRALLEEHAVVD